MRRKNGLQGEVKTRRGTSEPDTVSVAEIADTGELLEHALENHDTSVSADLSAGDLDARWDQAESGGEETAGGSAPTPDQDVVDEIGQAIGVTYQEGEPLRVGFKERQRDEHRWELDPASSEDYAERSGSGTRTAERILRMKHRDQYKPTSE